MEASTKPSHFRHYLIVAAGISMTLGPIALVFSCAGIFFVPVTQHLGVGLAALALYLTFLQLTQVVVLPIWGKLIAKHDVRILLSAAVLVVGLSLFAMGSFNAVWQFYVAGVTLGLAMPFFLYLAIPTLLNRWFKTRVGFFMGLCFAFSGVGGVLFNPLGGYLISSYGYPVAYRVFGILAIAICLPFTAFAIRNSPSDLGLLPYGDEGSSSADSGPSVATAMTGVSAATAMKSPTFYALALFAGLVSFTTGIYTLLPSYATTLPLAATIATLAATLASFAMLGQAIGKIGLGVINDKSVVLGLCTGMGGGLLGLLALWLAPSSVMTMYGGGMLYGIFYASALVQVPLMVRAAFGGREYSQIYSRISMVAALVSAFGATMWGLIIDKTGGYAGMFGGGLVLIGICLLLGAYSLRAGKNLEHTAG